MSTHIQHVYIIDDDEAIRDSMSMLLETINLPHRCFSSAAEFLEFFDESQRGCLVLDIRMPGMNGLDMQKKLNELGSVLPIIFITGHGDIPMAVEAMRGGALDFMRKPFREQDLLDRIQQALDHESGKYDAHEIMSDIKKNIATLTPKEHDIFNRVAQGQANKVIALELGVSERTIEVHRAQVMKKLQVKTLADLVRIKLDGERSTSTV